MKKIALLMFAIPILGCGTETPVVEERPAVIERPSPVVTSSESFRSQPIEPELIGINVEYADNNVDPTPLNANGIRLEFDQPLKLYRIILRSDEHGPSLDWLPRGIVDDKNIGRFVRIMPGEGSVLLEFDTKYEIEIYVQDTHCREGVDGISFRTMPKP